jgi:hypothetical protein
MRIFKNENNELFSIYVLQRDNKYHLVCNGTISDSDENENEIFEIEKGVIYFLKEDGYRLL